MKTKILSLIIVIGIVSFCGCNSGQKKESETTDEQQTESTEVAELKKTNLKVFGNCGMCKERIEKAVNGIEGVASAEWDKATKMLTVSHDGSVKDDDIHKAVSSVGHDTEKAKADDAVYEAIPECCHYRENPSTH